ncbi:MAG: hypothetical protein ACRDEA_13170, partial [Microcystaceae cyanobacterium]
PVPDKLVQNQLLHLMQGSPDSCYSSDSPSLAELCLRCFVSHIIEQVCIQLEAQFGTQHGFTRYDLFPFVLEESSQLRRGKISQNKTPYRSLTREILQTFNPAQGYLFHCQGQAMGDIAPRIGLKAQYQVTICKWVSLSSACW